MPARLVSVARNAIVFRLDRRAWRPDPLPAPWDVSRGVFVTLRKADGALRGCIGHLAPVHPTLADEIAACAVSAAFEDPRFRPVARDEIDALSLELSLLEPPRPAVREELDPERYGVIVTHGRRRGVLLPGIDGVTTVEEQLGIALRKAGIPPNQPYGIERFEVTKIEEG